MSKNRSRTRNWSIGQSGGMSQVFALFKFHSVYLDCFEVDVGCTILSLAMEAGLHAFYELSGAEIGLQARTVVRLSIPSESLSFFNQNPK